MQSKLSLSVLTKDSILNVLDGKGTILISALAQTQDIRINITCRGNLSLVDAKIREGIGQELRDLQRQTNITFIYVTHDQEEALALSDRIAVMPDGKVEQIGTPEAIYSRPATRFVAQFIGKANFLLRTILEISNEVIVVEVNGVKIQAISHNYQPTTGESVTSMIRPEQFYISSDPEVVNQITGKVDSIIYIGQLVEYRVTTSIGTLTITQL